MPENPIVSFDDEPLVLVDSADHDRGFLDKASCHDGDGVLHRAFSVFLFNSKLELLLQQRSGLKRLWPMWWSNSCCSHPRKGETMAQAVQRRTREELASDAAMVFTHKFEYHARFGAEGSEHELCHVFVGVSDGRVQVNANEVAAMRWVAPQDLDAALADAAAPYTPWLRLEWQALRAHHWPLIERLAAEHQKG
jgi:isopentenyl-diphosphate delta-isomerase